MCFPVCTLACIESPGSPDSPDSLDSRIPRIPRILRYLIAATWGVITEERITAPSEFGFHTATALHLTK